MNVVPESQFLLFKNMNAGDTEVVGWPEFTPPLSRGEMWASEECMAEAEWESDLENLRLFAA